MSLFYFEHAVSLAANGTVELSVPGGNSLMVLDLSGSVQMQIDNADKSAIRKGVGFEDKPFERVRLTETAGAAASVTIGLSGGSVKDSRFSATGGIVTNSGDTLVNPAAVTIGAVAGQILAANTSRNSALIVPDSSTETLYIGADNTVSAANGVPVAPGASLYYGGGGAVWGIRGGALDISVRILEGRD